METINVGSKIVVRYIMSKHREGNKTTWVRVDTYNDYEYIFLGWSVLFDGIYYPVSGGYYGEDEPEPAYFEQGNKHRLAVIQPFDKSGRFRKPRYCQFEDIMHVQEELWI